MDNKDRRRRGSDIPVRVHSVPKENSSKSECFTDIPKNKIISSSFLESKPASNCPSNALPISFSQDNDMSMDDNGASEEMAAESDEEEPNNDRVDDGVDRYVISLGARADRDQIVEDLGQATIEEEDSYHVEHLSCSVTSATNRNFTLTSTTDLLAALHFQTDGLRPSTPPVIHREPERVYEYLPRHREFFILSEFVADMIAVANSVEPQVFPDDASLPFDLHGQAAHPDRTFPSKGKVIQELRDTAAIHSITKVGLNAFFAVLHRNSALNVPVKVNPRTGNEIHLWEKYLKHDPRKQFVDVCRHGCCVYIGALKTAMFCPNKECQEPRFRPCNYNGQGGCKNLNCNPFTTTHVQRRSFHVMCYRSIIIKLLDLYKKSLNELPNLFSYDKTRVKVDGGLTDILDGEVPQQHMEEMRRRFLDRRDQYAYDNFGAILHECSLVCSAFYDGDKLYERSDDSLWPMLISIMNCDPCFRTTLGLALFMVLIHNLPMGSKAEQCIIDDMFTAELEQLFDGILFEFLTPQGQKHAVFIQARMIFFHLDTRAQDKVWHISSAGGMAGCTFCSDCKGLSRPSLGTCVYPGAGTFLPENHVLKSIGEFDVYKQGYFGEGGAEINALIGKEICSLARSIPISGKGGDAVDSEFDDIEGDIVDDDENVLDRNVNSMTHNRSVQLPADKMWFSKEFPWCDVAAACWSPYNDPFTHTFQRVKHEEYLGNARCAGLLRNAYIADCIRLKKPIAKSAPAKWVYNGVHYPLSMWATWDEPTMLFENAAPDLMHRESNAADYTFKLLKGERGIDLASRKLSLAENCFPFLANKGNPIPWVASKFSQCLADSVMMCLNVPSQCKRDYKFDLPFHHSGYLNSHQKMVFFSVYVAFIFSFTDITMQYRHLFERCASDLCKILAPILMKDELPDLVNHVIETTALREKMTPSSEHAFIFHEIIEIVNALKSFGIVKSLMCFFGERVMHMIAKGVPDGGVSYLITVVERFVARENAFDHNMLSYTENLKRFLDNHGRFSPKVLKLDGQFIELALNNWSKGVLFDDIIAFVISQEIEDVVIKSPFMRLYFTYRRLVAIMESEHVVDEQLKKRDLAEFPNFVVWIRELYMCYKRSSNFSSETVQHLVRDVHFYPNDNVFTDVDVMMADFVDEGILFLSDFGGIITDLATFATAGEHTIAAFTKALVKGVEFRGRGQLYAENSLGRDREKRRTYVPQNPGNILNNNWHHTFHINSWGKVEDWYIAHPNNPEKKQLKPKVLFGQFNYFFRLHIPSDTLIDKLAFANMVLRTPSVPNDMRGSHRYIDMRENSGFYHAKQFIVLNYVEATNLALSPLDTYDYPIANPNSGVKESANKIKSYPLKISKMSRTEVRRMYMIELHRERLHIKYESILEDKDATKCCEAIVLDHHTKRSHIVNC